MSKNADVKKCSKLININKTNWLKNIDVCPVTIKDIEIMISVLDKINAYNGHDINQIDVMDSVKLDIIYSSLRVVCKLYTEYSNYVVQNILCNQFHTIFDCENMIMYDIFFDQLNQDLDYFINSVIITKYKDSIDRMMLKKDIIEYLISTFDCPFYTEMFEKMMYVVDKNFFEEHDSVFNFIVEEIDEYSKHRFWNNCKVITTIVDKIFSENCTAKESAKIINTLEEYINLHLLFQEDCSELDIYSELKINNDLMNNLQKV